MWVRMIAQIYAQRRRIRPYKRCRPVVGEGVRYMREIAYSLLLTENNQQPD